MWKCIYTAKNVPLIHALNLYTSTYEHAFSEVSRLFDMWAQSGPFLSNPELLKDLASGGRSDESNTVFCMKSGRFCQVLWNPHLGENILCTQSYSCASEAVLLPPPPIDMSPGFGDHGGELSLLYLPHWWLRTIDCRILCEKSLQAYCSVCPRPRDMSRGKHAQQ